LISVSGLITTCCGAFIAFLSGSGWGEEYTQLEGFLEAAAVRILRKYFLTS
jgi:hypothetical protein